MLLIGWKPKLDWCIFVLRQRPKTRPIENCRKWTPFIGSLTLYFQHRSQRDDYKRFLRANTYLCMLLQSGNNQLILHTKTFEVYCSKEQGLGFKNAASARCFAKSAPARCNQI